MKKYKQIPFTVEDAMKIQNGEVKGKIETREGNKARILCTDLVRTSYPLVAAVEAKDREHVLVYVYSKEGKYVVYSEDFLDLLLYLEEEVKPTFKPFDRVLARDGDAHKWQIDFFERYNDSKEFPYFCMHSAYSQCIPYEGNEHLLGTSDAPE